MILYDSQDKIYEIEGGRNLVYYESLNSQYVTKTQLAYAWSKNPYGVSVGVPARCVKLTTPFVIYKINSLVYSPDTNNLTFTIVDTNNLDYYIVSENSTLPDINSLEWEAVKPSQLLVA